MAEAKPQDVEMLDSQTSQREQICPDQVQNSAGGYVWQVDDLRRFRRFLVLGVESGSYYINQQELGRQNSAALLNLLAADRGPEVVQTLVDYSTAGRCARQDPIILALAACARSNHLETKRAAYAAVRQILRIPTHLFTFVNHCEALSQNKEPKSSGWGRAHRKAVAKWYTERKGKSLAIAVTKYKQREGWSHTDLFRLCHLKPTDPAVALVIRFVVKGLKAAQKMAEETEASEEVLNVLEFLQATEAVKSMSEDDLVATIRKHRLVREHVPTQFLKSLKVWEALLQEMPMTAMIRNLNKMTAIGLMADPNGLQTVCNNLRNEKKLHDARIHPFKLLLALRQYQEGHGDRGSLHWEPNPAVIGALDDAFYLAFKHVEPTNKRYLLAIDVSGSMSWGGCCGASTITPRVASAAMAMVTARTEPQYHLLGFSHQLVPLNINSTMKLDTVVQVISSVPMGGTDCAQPMLYAMEKNLKVDVFIVYTDSETHSGGIHPSEALRQYRAASGVDAKLIVVAMTSNGFTLADPNDSGMLDIAGFDSAAPDIMGEFVAGNI